jgi:membrane-associated protease RseP (regulator of RpoE activity)
LADEAGAPEVPLTPMGWLAQNGVYLAIVAALVVWLYSSFGWAGLPSALWTVLGIGFIIFIHELGHFLVAKWCDVHVLTFSIGFGPAIPGCSFKRGETTYKLSLLPLGGYVNMVGEGTDADENEDYPRSFKNKPVGQRMAIISAGVIMNLIFGVVAFIFVMRTHGVERTTATVGMVDPGSPAWEEGVHPGWRIERIGSNEHPFFQDLQSSVALAGKDEIISFDFVNPDDKEKTPIHRDLKPRRGEGNLNPVIGVGMAPLLQVTKQFDKELTPLPYLRNSPAAAARKIDLKPGDVVLKTTDPDKPDEPEPGLALRHDLAGRTWDHAEFARRMQRLSGKTMKIEVVRRGKEAETVPLSGAGFEFEDLIVGTSALPEPGAAYDPLVVSPLPKDTDPRDADQRNPEGKLRDLFAFRKRMQDLAGRPVVIQVLRKGEGEPVNLFVPPAFHRVFGMRMDIGPVAAVRKDSPSAKAGLQVGDTITGVRLTDNTEQTLLDLGEGRAGPLDPLHLPDQLAEAAARHRGRKWVTLTVDRRQADHQRKPVPLPPMEWDARWDASTEYPFTSTSPLSIPQLGLAYRVKSVIRSPDILRRLDPGAGLLAGGPGADLLTAAQGYLKFKKENPVPVWKVYRLGLLIVLVLAGLAFGYASAGVLARRGLSSRGSLYLLLALLSLSAASGIAWHAWPLLPLSHATEYAASPESGDIISKIRVQRDDKGGPQWGQWVNLWVARGEEKVYEQWVRAFLDCQPASIKKVEVIIRRDGEESEPLELTLVEDPSWPLRTPDALGLLLAEDRHLHRAESMMEALREGGKETWGFITNIYLGLSRLLTGRVSPKTLGGPIEIVSSTFTLAHHDPYKLILFLGILSINLAVVNFLPIPLLDGGHMVFLIYEKLRGKPASEQVRAIAAYIGLAILLTLMVYVVIIDGQRRGWW